MHTSLTLLHPVLAASSSSSSKGGSGAYSILFLVAIFAVVYFIFLRPARNRQRAAATVRRQVEVGDEITTTAGLIATVVAVDDDFLTLEVAPGVHCRYVPAAVLRVNNADDEPDDAESTATETATETERDVSTHEVIDKPAVDLDHPRSDVASATEDPSDIDEHGTTETPDEPASA